MPINLINNIAFLIALVAVGQIVLARFHRSTRERQILLGVVFGSVTLLGMLNPVTVLPGLIFDGRSVVLATAGVVGGGFVAAFAALMAATYRMQLGGMGAPIGITVIVTSALIGVLARNFWLRQGILPKAKQFFILGVAVQAIQSVAFTQLPAGTGYAFITEAWWVLLLLYPMATMLLCLVFRNYEQQLIDELALKTAEAQVKRERTILRTLIDTVPDLIWLKDPNGIYLSCNRRFEQFLGAREADIVGKTDHDFVNKELADSFRAHDQEAIARNGTQVNEEEITFASDGHRELLETTKTPMRDDNGQLIGILGIGHDRTERKLSEIALENREKQLRFVLEGSGLGFWDWDIVSGKVDRNDQWARMLGYTHDEIKNTTQQWTDFIHPEDRECAWNSISDVLMGRSDMHCLEYRMLHKDGSVRWILDRASVMQTDQDGKPLRMCGTHTDITAHKNSELELRQHRHHLQELVELQTRDLTVAKDAAESASRAKSAFLANMSHELRTPMNGVLGMIDMAKRHMVNPEGMDKLNKAKFAAEQLLGVLNDILDLSKIEADRLALENLPLQVRKCVENVVSTLECRAAEKGILLKVEMPSEVADVSLLGDSLRLTQILFNLVGNAVKFTSQGFVLLRASSINSDSTSMTIRFEVCDTGIGIEPAVQARLFQSFEQADNSMARQYGGTGLGLAISKHLVELMGGEIGVESTIGQGSTFWVILKLERSKPLESASPSASDSQLTDEQLLKRDFSGARILLAEDEPITQEISRDLLEEVGLSVDVAEDGKKAVALAKQLPYALVLMDMQMPMMTGVEATIAIRADSLNKGTPILAMTANAFKEDREACLAAGMNDHIAKPVIPEHLHATLLRWLRRQAGNH